MTHPIRTARVYVLALVLAAFMVAGAQDYMCDGEYGGVLRVAFHEVPTTMDVIATTGAQPELSYLVYEGLIDIDNAFQPVPSLAESWEVSDDGLSWRFVLRSGVTFHDGAPLTSADAIASIERMLLMGPRRGEFAAIESFEAIDDLTFDINLSRRWGALPETFASTMGSLVVLQAGIAEQYGDEWIPTTAIEDNIGTGAYRLVEVIPDEMYRFVRNEDYQRTYFEPSGFSGARCQYADEIIFYPITEEATRVAALIGGEVELAMRLPSDDLERLQNDARTNVNLMEPGRRLYYKLNMNHGPFADHTLRRAVQAALDPAAALTVHGSPDIWNINHCARNGEDMWMCSYVADPYFVNDLDFARLLVEESGYAGEEIIFLITDDMPVPFRTGPVVQDRLQQIGLNVRLVAVDRPTYRDMWFPEGEWHIKGTHSTADVPSSYMNGTSRDRRGELHPDWPTAEWDYWFVMSQAEDDLAIRQKAMEQLHIIHTQIAHELWIGDVSELLGYSPRLEGVPNFVYLNFTNAWFRD